MTYRRANMTYKIIIATATVLLLVAGGAQAEKGVSDTTIKLGEVMPFTGPPSLLGVAMALGSKVAAAEINEAGGINGRMIELIQMDDGYVPSRTVQAAVKLLEVDEVFAFTATSGSTHTLAVMEILKEDKVPLLQSGAPNKAHYTPPRENVFVVGKGYGPAITELVRHMATVRKNAVWASITQDDDFGSDLLKGYQVAVKELGLNSVVSLKYKRGQKDFSAEMLRLKNAGVTAMLNGGIISEAVAMLKEGHKLDMDLMSGTVWTGRVPVVQKLVGEAGGNWFIVDYVATMQEPAGQAFMAKAEKYLTEKEIPRINRYAFVTYAGFQVFAEAMRKCGKNLTRACVLDKLETVKDLDVSGIMGPVSFGKGVRYSNQKVRILRNDFANMTFTPVTGYR